MGRGDFIGDGSGGGWDSRCGGGGGPGDIEGGIPSCFGSGDSGCAADHVPGYGTGGCITYDGEYWGCGEYFAGEYGLDGVGGCWL